MDATFTTARAASTTRRFELRPAIAAASISSALAGAIHLAAARNHDEQGLLLWLFVLCGTAQLLWALAIALQPSRWMLALGIVLNGSALLTWALTRTVGVPFVEALSEVEAVGRQDLGAASFAALGVGAALAALARPRVVRLLAAPWVAVLAIFATASALPSLAASHVHEHGDDHSHLAAGAHAHDGTTAHAHEGGDGHAHEAGDPAHEEEGHAHDPDAPSDGHDHGGDGDHAGTGHDHDGVSDPSAGHDHPDDQGGHDHPAGPTHPGGSHHDPDDPVDPDDPDDGHHHPDPDDPTDPEPPITSLDDPRLTPEQFDAAIDLIVRTTDGMRPFVTVEDVIAAGYVSIGDGGSPGTYEHFVNWSYLTDAYELDPQHIESIVMKMNADGTSRVVSAMYILTVGKTMADAPDIAGELTTWHDHDNLCFSGGQLVGLAVNGTCAQGTLLNTPPMLHVWIEANPCGPFVGIDEHGIQCDATHEH